MKVVVLSSGSKGNVTYLETKNKKFLLDAGRNYKYINENLIIVLSFWILEVRKGMQR